MTRDTRVEIYGQVYSLRTSLDPAYIEELARLVDARMRALANQTDVVDTRRLAVLAALTLADELRQAQPAAGPAAVASDEVLRRIEALSEVLEAALRPEP
jgi:cell division protein ZapA